MDQGIIENWDATTNVGNTMSELRKSITSGQFYLAKLPVWCGSKIVLILKGEKVRSELAAAILNVRHVGLLHMLDVGRLPCEKIDAVVYVDSDDLMKFKQKWDKERNESLDRLLQIDSEDDYI